MNNDKILKDREIILENDFIEEKVAILRKGKKNYCLVKVEE